MTVNIPALLMSFFFYAFVLGIGIWASIKSKKLETARTGWLETLFLANRSVNLFMGTFTMTGEKYIILLTIFCCFTNKMGECEKLTGRHF